MKKTKILIITSTGGSGHIQAARAKRAMLLQENPDYEIVEKDLMQDIFGCGFGPLFVQMWNKAQKKGKTHTLEMYGQLAVFFGVISFIPVYYRLLSLLVKEQFDRIIDVQPNATSAIARAVRAYERITGIRLTIEKFVIEFPTDRVIHYFKQIKRLTSIDRSYLKLITMSPLTAKNETDEMFWKKNCRLPLKQVSYEAPLIRESFYDYQIKERDPEEVFLLSIDVPNAIDRLCILQALNRGPLPFSENDEKIDLVIQPDLKVVTMMLGSQPAHKATLRYVDHFIEMAAKTERNICLFVFCANQTNEDMPLIESITKRVTRNEDHPKNLTILPMPYQKDDVIAPLYHRSDATITRSGGVTSMELMAVSRGKIWIHTEKPLQNDDLLKVKIWGMPRWEEGNALYLKAKKGADLVCPDTFVSKWTPFFTEESRQAHPSLAH